MSAALKRFGRDAVTSPIRSFVAALLFVGATLGLAERAFATPPAAGTVITSTASATYNDSLGTARTATSNTVQTTVQQVASSTIVAAVQNKATVPGSTVIYAETLTNTGNGTDTFALTTANSGAYSMTSVTLYADNGSGQPTGPAITSTGSLAAGATFRFVVSAVVPITALATQTNTVTTTATSAFDNTRTSNVADVTTITLDAVVGLTKAISTSSGAPGSGPYTYTLTYSNTGASYANAVRMTDVIPTGMTYVAGSGRWSVTGSTALTDGTGDTQGTVPTIDYSVTGSTVTAIVSNVPAGTSGSVTFQVTVAAGTAAGTINNTAGLQYVTTIGNTLTGSSNTVPFTVTQVTSVTVTAPTATAGATPGTTLSYANVIRNTGNASDTFNVTYANPGTGGFPAGTTFAYFKADGVTPLTDTNADGTIDTGVLAAGASTTVVLKVTLPAGAGAIGGPYNVTSTVTSVFDATKTASATDTVTAVANASVDITNNSAGGPGAGAGPEASPVATNAVGIGSSTTFALVVANTFGNADNYNLAASTSSTFATTTLPTGWTATFYADASANCSSLGSTVTATGTIAAGASARFCAVVGIPSSGAGATAGNTEVYFRALSPSSSVTDTVHDRVTVNAARSLTFTTAAAAQVVPGGSVVYTHTLTNTGNATEGNGTGSTITLGSTDTQSGYTSAQYYDANGNGVLDAGDPVIPAGGLAAIAALSAGLAPGASITIFDKVTAPSGATVGTVDTTTVTVTTANGTNPGSAPPSASANDVTTVIANSTITLLKEQSLDANCTGTAGTYAQTPITTGAVPNACIRYRVTATNTGAVPATLVVLSDITPSYTLYDTGGGTAPAATTVGTITAPTAGTAGTVTATIGTLAPSATAVITFGVRIQP